MKKITIAVVTIIIYMGLIPAKSQELDVNVTVNMEQLTQDARINVSTMEQDVENYLNNQRFTGEEWEGPKIPVEVAIYLTGGSGSSYSGRLFFVSKRTLDGEDGGESVSLRMVDQEWSFEYARFANLSFNPMRFHPFTSLLDFYAYLIIGMDLDTYGELDGSKMYDKAKQIIQMGAANGAAGYSTYAQPGEFTRYNLISEMTDLRYETLRTIIFAYYYDGLDLMAFDKPKAMAGLRQVVKDIVDFKKNKLSGPSVFMQLLFDAKSAELSLIFEGYEDKSVYKDLMYLDPSHTTTYEESMER